jgi:hypothetical protein
VSAALLLLLPIHSAVTCTGRPTGYMWCTWHSSLWWRLQLDRGSNVCRVVSQLGSSLFMKNWRSRKLALRLIFS